MVSGYDQELKDLQDVMYAMELRYSEREKAAQQDFQGVVDELKNKVSVQALSHRSLDCLLLLQAIEEFQMFP